MSDSKQDIKLFLDNEGNLNIARKNVSDENWKSLSNFWSNERLFLDSDLLIISIQEFLRKKSWLKYGWSNRGHSYEISNDLRSFLENSISKERDFEKYANSNEPQDINFSRLNISRELRDFQKQAVNRQINLPSGANFSVPGAGKTTTTLALWRYFNDRGDVNKLLVIAPKSAFSAWEIEPSEVFADAENIKIEQFLGQYIDRNVDLLITNFEQLDNSSKLDRLIDWVIRNNVMLVIDEAHRVKAGPKSVRWNAIKKLTTFAKRIDLLTGTPMPQGYEDLVNLFCLSWQPLADNFFTLERMQSLSRGGIFERTTKLELNLPAMNIHPVVIEMGDLHKEIYTSLTAIYSGILSARMSSRNLMRQKGKAVMTLIIAATNPSLISGFRTEDSFLGLEWPPKEVKQDEDLLEKVRNYQNREAVSKMNWLLAFMKKSKEEGKKVLIWSNFIGNLRIAEIMLKQFNPVMIYGATPQEERVSLIERFKHDPDCFALITNPQTLGEGISLHHHCHEAVYIDRTYNAGLYLQSLDRIHRLGLAEDQVTNVYVLQSEGTVDTAISSRLQSKIQTMANALDDQSLSRSSIENCDDDINYSEIVGINDEDLNDLLSHLKLSG